jgi:hypothetical protein
MKKISILFMRLTLVLCAFQFHSVMAQSYFLHAEYRNDWYGNGYPMGQDVINHPGFTLEAEVAGDQFVIQADNSFNKWAATDSIELNEVVNLNWFGGGNPDDNVLKDPAIVGGYYTTRIVNNGYNNTQGIVMYTSNPPVLFTTLDAVTQAPLFNAVMAGQDVILTVNLISAPSPEEFVYVRYTTDNFATSTIIEVNLTGPSFESGTTSIPGFAAGTTVTYYAFTSTVDLFANPQSNVDLVTLRQATNNGNNYSYTVMAGPAVTAPVQFRVNMSNQTVSPDGVFLAGTFNGFSSTANPMVAVGGGVYSLIVDLDTGLTFQYKFVNGTGVGAQFENVPTACGVDDGNGIFNREINVSGIGAILPVVCFGECFDCVAASTVEVSFRVNMNNQTVSGQGVHVAGSFNGFDPSATPMTDSGNGVYVATVSIPENQTIQYKFINGNSFANEETVPSACGVLNTFGGFDREITLAANDTILDVVCFGECSDCVAPVNINVTFRVKMSNQTVSAQGVHVAGNFNGFSPTATPMTDAGNGVYEATVVVNGNQNLQYKFINGDTFAGQESVPAACGINDGFGGFNRISFVGVSDTTFSTVCFNECGDCVILTPVNVTFRVNMSNQTVSAQGVHVAGSFNNWDPAATPLTDIGGGVYEAVVSIPAPQTVYYKFINGNTFAGEETVPAFCGFPNTFGGFDRELDLFGDTVLPVVCFASCFDCAPASFVNVTFSVDMSNVTVSPFGVHVAGSFNNWDPVANPLINIGNNVFQTTIILPENQTFQYKFINGNNFGGQENVPDACGVLNTFGGYDREFSTTANDTALGLVCFSSCSACVIPVYSFVTFRVNMDQVGASPNGVYLAASPFGFNPTAVPMQNTTGTIYEAVLQLEEGETIQYKFVNGSGPGAVFETVPVACGVNDGSGIFNRELTASANDTTLAVVCFSDCVDCLPVSLTENVVEEQLVVYPNPGNGLFYLSGYTNRVMDVEVFDASGRRVHAEANRLITENQSIDLQLLGEGYYFLRLSSAEQVKILPLLIRK